MSLLHDKKNSHYDYGNEEMSELDSMYEVHDFSLVFSVLPVAAFSVVPFVAALRLELSFYLFFLQ